MDRRDSETLAGVAVVAGLIEACMHWFPWNRVIGREMQPPWTYMAGLCPILALFTGWTSMRRGLRVRDAVLGLHVIVASSGLAVAVGYAIDQIAGHAMRARIDGKRSARRID